jgi:hypothetical protein
MLKFSHIGIPTKNKMPGEIYSPKFKIYTTGYKDTIYKIEWMRFEPGCPLPEIIKNIPHVAFEVDNLSEAIKGKKIIIEPNSPSEGILVVFIEDNGAPVELIQIKSPA